MEGRRADDRKRKPRSKNETAQAYEMLLSWFQMCKVLLARTGGREQARQKCNLIGGGKASCGSKGHLVHLVSPASVPSSSE